MTVVDVPSTTLSSSPIVTELPCVPDILTFSAPAIMLADNFKLVSSAFVIAIVTPLTFFEAFSLISFVSDTPALSVTLTVAAVSDAETNSTVYVFPLIVTSADGSSLLKATFSAVFNNTRSSPFVADAIVNFCPNIVISCPSESE